ncbi:hypothetical protein AB0H71_16580 [Nocardia sp. NPDC050697]|uniref:hypothetical protein n=1 Tax=Nocardia sp. NPDC050697 TaxID=3155158 RepID=UPI0033CE1F0D
MSMPQLRKPPPSAYTLIGDGEHSQVFRRHSSRYCIQLFTLNCPELTPHKVRLEYDYLRKVYDALPQLIPWQRLFVRSLNHHISEAVVVKRWVHTDVMLPLGRIRRTQLRHGTAAQLDQFIAITRTLVENAQRRPTLLPDIFDDRFRNLVIDRAGDLRLLDTNRLVNTNALRALASDETLDITRHWIHGRFFRRMIYLEAAFRERTTRELQHDPLYRRYLSPDDFEALVQESRTRHEFV